MEIKGAQELEREVIKTDLCTLCGACIGLCPYFRAYKGKVVLLDNCNLTQGRCYSFCPRTTTDLEIIHREIFQIPYPGNSLGSFREIFIARSTDQKILARSQYGGITSALISFALKRGMIEGAILTRRGKDLLSAGVLIQRAEEVLPCAGSNYVASPTLQALHQEVKPGLKNLAVVGIPCQVLALRKMQLSPLQDRESLKKSTLVIGLFCTWALSYREFFSFLKNSYPISKIEKMDIPPPPANVLQIEFPEKKEALPLDLIRPFIRPTCQVCLDMTAEFADLSVGAAEGIPGWNTVIIRSAQGKKIWEEAKEEKIIETADLPEANLAHLKEAALFKKKKALENIVKRTGDKENLLYLKGTDSLRHLLPI